MENDKLHSNTIVIGLCDDQIDERTRIADHVRRFFSQTGKDSPVIREFECGLSLVDAYEDEQRFDFLILDILMAASNGIETAKSIRKYDRFVPIFFLTNSREYAVDSYDVNAFYYLLKASIPEKLNIILQKVVLNLNKIRNEMITLKTKDGFESVYCRHIEFVEVFGRKTIYYLCSGHKVETISTLKSAEAKLLVHPEFCKIHRCIIVNITRITLCTKKHVQTKFSGVLPISRSMYAELKQKLLNQ